MHLRRAMIAPPNWWWDFRSEALHSAMTLTRASSRRSWHGGVPTAYSNNQPGWARDPVTDAKWGIDLEMQSTNAIKYSEALDNAAWSTDAGRVTVSANVTTAPDGNATADKIIPSATSTWHDLYFSAGVTIASGVPYGASVFAKAAELRYLTLNVYGSSGTKWAGITVDLVTGTVTKTGSGAGGALTGYGITALANGWYRVWIIASLTDTVGYLAIEPVNTGTPTYGNYGLAAAWSGNASDGLYAWGAQMETGGVGVTSYIPTTSATATRAQDLLSIPLSSVRSWDATKGAVFMATYRLATVLPSSPGYNGPAFALHDGTVNNLIVAYANNGGSQKDGAFSKAAGAVQLNVDGAALPAAYTRRRIALGWSASRGIMYHDNVADFAGQALTALPSGMTSLQLGNVSPINTASLNGTLESIAYYAGARADAFIQSVSR